MWAQRLVFSVEEMFDIFANAQFICHQTKWETNFVDLNTYRKTQIFISAVFEATSTLKNKVLFRTF